MSTLQLEATTVQHAIAEHFRDQARWRREKAAEYPEDSRNESSAQALEALAAFVMALSPSDARLQELGRHGMITDVFSPPTYPFAEAATAISRFGFNTSVEHDAFLTGLVAALRRDVGAWEQVFGPVPADRSHLTVIK